VVCQSPAGSDDPNAKVLDEIARALAAATDASGRRLEVIRIPSPGLVIDDSGEIAPASHVNFVIANGVVAVPTYGTPVAEGAIEALRTVFPDRKIVGIDSRALLGSGDAGGGSFHCITREEPA
jgi:agmatine deiminase